MIEQSEKDWIEHYGFIMVAFAHMTDWKLTDSELNVINEKIKFLLQQTNQSFDEEGIAQKVITVVNRYHELKEKNDNVIMDALIMTCESSKKADWFDKLEATALLQCLGDIAESDRKIEKTEVQFLNNIANIFEIAPPRI